MLAFHWVVCKMPGFHRVRFPVGRLSDASAMLVSIFLDSTLASHTVSSSHSPCGCCCIMVSIGLQCKEVGIWTAHGFQRAWSFYSMWGGLCFHFLVNFWLKIAPYCTFYFILQNGKGHATWSLFQETDLWCHQSDIFSSLWDFANSHPWEFYVPKLVLIWHVTECAQGGDIFEFVKFGES